MPKMNGLDVVVAVVGDDPADEDEDEDDDFFEEPHAAATMASTAIKATTPNHVRYLPCMISTTLSCLAPKPDYTGAATATVTIAVPKMLALARD